MSDNTETVLKRLLNERILVLDGAMGTMIQARKLFEADFRGEAFANHSVDLIGNNDILCLTQPGIIKDIHLRFLEAGADIVSTNTFNGSTISQADYQTENYVYGINKAGAEIAKTAVAEFTRRQPDRPRFVAGSMGPTNKALSMSPDIENPGYRAVTFADMAEAYKTQAEGLVDGGVDIILIETVFDTLNAKAALFAVQDVFEERGKKLPIWISGTIIDTGGRLLSGQTTEAFFNSIRHANPVCVGFNCALGAKTMRPFLQELSTVADVPVSVHPNAGLPDELGIYNDSPEYMATIIREFAESGLVNIVGGCCGTTPEHITAIARAVKGVQPRAVPTAKRYCRLSGLEPLTIQPYSLFVNIGERTNVAGSSKFAKLIREEKYEAALKVARQQVNKGAQVIDVNMDDAMLDAQKAMPTFLNMVASDPEISRVPVMIDSSDFEVIEAGLRCLQGKGIVNSISLKEGEEEFIRRAKRIMRYGAAVVVMAFDENGQAVSYQHKVDVCTRAYDILTKRAGFPPEDIIFDPNILTIATGMEEHSDYAVAFIRACKTIKETLPYCLVSGGISNLSFAFRGNNTIREAMHSVFLYHAVRAGLDMGIVNAGQLAVYEEIPEDLRTLVEDVILNRHPEATARLTEKATEITGGGEKIKKDLSWHNGSLSERLSYQLVNGTIDYIERDIEEALSAYDNPVEIIEGPLMDGMNRVGDLFGTGKMFLPQVIRSARVMKKAVAILSPHLLAAKTGTGQNVRKVLLATVKGDVHDIGKNITKIVLECNNYEVIDLGVMTPAEKILQTALDEQVDVIGLSGLITPSLGEMCHVASEMERLKMKLPLLIGGATTSRLHTAVKIEPNYSGPSVYVPDASRSVQILGKLLSDEQGKEYIRHIKKEYAGIRKEREAKQKNTSLIPLTQARLNGVKIDWGTYSPPKPKQLGITVFDNYDIKNIIDYIDWTPLFSAFDLPGRYPRILEYTHLGDEPKKLFADAQRMLTEIIDKKLIRAKAIIGLFPANAIGDDVEIYTDDNRNTLQTTIHFLRQQKKRADGKENLALSDFIAPKSSRIDDYIGAFAVSAGFGVDEIRRAYDKAHDEYNSILIRALADRLAEALAEKIHQQVRREFWGYEEIPENEGQWNPDSNYIGIRPAPGYPACPDHTEKQLLFDLLNVRGKIGVRLTDSYVMIPAASVSGWYFSHPEAKYFGVGRIGEDQLADYAKRKICSVDDLRKWLATQLY